MKQLPDSEPVLTPEAVNRIDSSDRRAANPEGLVQVVEAQRGARLKYFLTQLRFSAESLGPEVTERLETCEEKLLIANIRPNSHRHGNCSLTTGRRGLVRCCTGGGPPPPRAEVAPRRTLTSRPRRGRASAASGAVAGQR